MSRLLRQCAQAERNLSTAYEILSKQLKDDPEVAPLFKQMATDEEAHAQKIELAIRLEVNEGSIIDEKVCPETVTRLLERSAEFVKRAEEGLSRSEAAIMAKNMEGEFMLLHFEAAAQLQESSLANLFKVLSRGDKEHLDTLKKIASTI